LADQWYPRLVGGPNFAEGIQAFVEKRSPSWKNSVGVDLQHPHLTVETTCATKSDYGVVRSNVRGLFPLTVPYCRPFGCSNELGSWQCGGHCLGFGGPVVSSVGRSNVRGLFPLTVLNSSSLVTVSPQKPGCLRQS
jgi:hypothetical protein